MAAASALNWCCLMFQKLTNSGPRFESPNAECNLIFLSGRFNVRRVVLAMAPAPTPVGRLNYA
jgi:hypothetical protein